MISQVPRKRGRERDLYTRIAKGKAIDPNLTPAPIYVANLLNIVVPIISAVNVDLAKFKNVPSTWIRIVSQGEPGFALLA